MLVFIVRDRQLTVLTMKTLLEILLIILAIPIVIFGLWLVIFAVSLHFENERKITAAVTSGFPGAEISINGRVDFDPTNQICFDVTARSKSLAQSKRAIVMVGGDLDGGTWPLNPRRFSSMQECKKSFSRG